MINAQQLSSAVNQAVVALNTYKLTSGLQKLDIENVTKITTSLAANSIQLSVAGYALDVLLGEKAIKTLSELQSAITSKDGATIAKTMAQADSVVSNAAMTPASYLRNLNTIFDNYTDAMQTPTLPFRPAPETSGSNLVAAVTTLQAKIAVYVAKGSPPVLQDKLDRSSEVVLDSDRVVNGQAYQDDPQPYLNRLDLVIGDIP